MTPRSKAAREKARAILGRGTPICHICGRPIDTALKYPDPGSFVVDHLIPLAHGGADTMANKAAAHARCNWSKAAKEYAPIIRHSPALARALDSPEGRPHDSR